MLERRRGPSAASSGEELGVGAPRVDVDNRRLDEARSQVRHGRCGCH
jgi:hypothetical protein